MQFLNTLDSGGYNLPLLLQYADLFTPTAKLSFATNNVRHEQKINLIRNQCSISRK